MIPLDQKAIGKSDFCFFRSSPILHTGAEKSQVNGVVKTTLYAACLPIINGMALRSRVAFWWKYYRSSK